MSKDFKQMMDRLTSGGEPNWAVIMEVVELIQNKSISVKKANGEIRKKLLDPTEPVVLGTLHLLDSLVKNTPPALNKDIVSQDILSAMKAIVTGQGSSMPKAVDKVLEMVGEWKVAFGDDLSYKQVNNLFFELESNGYVIPEAKLATASFMEKAPAFEESDHCYYCTNNFGKVWSRRHHCRNCGRSICSNCHGKEQLALPHFGITEPQRVCVTCYKKLDKSSGSSSANQDTMDPIEGLLGTGRTTPTPPTSHPTATSDRERELQEQDELQMALAISLSEQQNATSNSGSKAASNTTSTKNDTSSVPKTTSSAPPPTIYATLQADLPPVAPTAPVSSSSAEERGSAGNELDRYLDRSRWEAKKTGSANTSATTTGQQQKQQQQTQQDVDSTYHPLAVTLRKQLERFTARMQAVTQQGSSIATDQAVLTLHQDLTAMHLQLLQQIDEVQQKKAHQENLLQKLNEAKEARVTLNAMRRQHQEQLLQQQREQEVLAQMQVQQKLALLRQQRAEEMAFGQTMQHQRLGLLSTQRQEYEMRLMQQREQERQQLIAQEQQVFQQQFGPTSLPAPPSSVHEQPGPLPLKEEPPSYNPQHGTGLYQTNYQSLPPPPPPSVAYSANGMPSTLPTAHHPSAVAQPLPPASLVQPPPPPASLVKPPLPPAAPEPTYQGQAPPPQYYPQQPYVPLDYQQQHTAVPVAQQVPLYQPVPPPALSEPQPPPALTEPPLPPTVQLQHQISEPLLISFD